MKNFDSLVTKCLNEHCKTKELWRPYNELQVKIFWSLYKNFLVPNHPEFDDFNISSSDNLISMYFNELPEVLHLAGDELCKKISDEETLHHTQDDVDKWAEQLYNMILRERGES